VVINRIGSVLLSAALAVTPALATTTHHRAAHSRSVHSTKTSAHSSLHSRRATKRHVLHGQQAIDPERATQIQQALIREHYLNGPASGAWDSTTVAAMQKYQSDQGWQTKLMPDSRALKKLGLGADYSNAINAKTGSFGGPVSTGDIPASQAAGFTTASGVQTSSGVNQ
jgi:hypothetical protein